MRVEAISIGPSDAITAVGSVNAVAGKGLVGDRHFYLDGAKPGRALTLIEAEVLEDVGLTGAQSRRQLVVRGMRLNGLVGKRFRVGKVECLGIELCEPCRHLQEMTRPGIVKQLVHRGGLNADILSDGRISVGDPISFDESFAERSPASQGSSVLAPLLKARAEIAGDLAEPIRLCIQRRDTGHVAFHGCLDWHSAVHGVWALVAYSRMTGDLRHEPLISQILDPGKLAAERALLRARPGFEMPYGRAWFLRLAREHELRFANGLLRPMAEDVLGSLLAYYRERRPEPRRGSYQSDSWALTNMHDYAAWSGDGAALETIRGLTAAHFIDAKGGCGYAPEAGHFMAVCTNWAWLVSKVLPQDGFDRWAEAFFARPGLPRPVTQPSNWHHHGLNFSRAWGLHALHAASGSTDAKRAYLEAYVAHFRETYDNPALWRGPYEGVGHWVPQFGMLALQPLFEM